jgi:hypothetical protein
MLTKKSRLAQRIAADLASLYQVPLLYAQAGGPLFRKMNLSEVQGGELRSKLDPSGRRAAIMDQIDGCTTRPSR